MLSAVRGLAVLATLGMFLVLVMGATVTNTGSGEGCGRSWPLCHGEFIPAYAVDTAIEYSHRFVTGVEGVLIVALALGALRLRGGRRGVKLLVALMVGTLVLQAGMGAAAVMYPQDDAVLALHFGISMVCLASTYMVARVVFEDEPAPTQRVPTPSDRTAPSNGYRLLAWAALLAVVGVAYLGAYMRHSGAELACSTWPSCDGELFPGLSGPTGLAFGHRLAAVGSTLLVAALVARSWPHRAANPALARTNLAALALILAQSVTGAVVVLSRLELFSTLAHAALVALLFVCLADGCRMTLPRRAPAPATRPALSPSAGAAD